MAMLRWEFEGEIHEFALKETTTIGRDKGNGVQIKDRGMSRKHCRIEKTPGGWKIVDLGSRNGIVVNDEKVPERDLATGDVMKIGNVPIEFEGDTPAAPKPPPPAPKKTAPPPPPLIAPEEKPEPTLQEIPDEAQLPVREEDPTPEPQPRVSRPRKRSNGPLLAGIAGGVMLALAAVLFVVYRGAQAAVDHAAKVKGRLKAGIEEINQLSPNDSIARDKKTEELLADAEFEKVAPETVKQLRAEHEKLHAAAEADRKAAKEVEPFLARFEKARESREAFEAQAKELFEESRELLKKYGDGGFADRLAAAGNDLKAFLERKEK
jgi:hypothetical protein